MINAMEKFIATKIPGVAAKGICTKKHDEAIEFLFDGITCWLIELEKRYGSECLSIIRDIQFKLGFETAKELKERYRLSSDINGALDLMWLLIIPFGIRMKAERIDDGRIREEKVACPIFDVFKKYDVDYCEELCISMCSGWLSAVNPNLKYEIVRRGSANRYCIKDIVDYNGI